MKLKTFFLLNAMVCIGGCATIPPEYSASLQKEREGILLLHKRHLQTVAELVDNWYNERLERINAEKRIQLDKITFKVNDPATNTLVTVVKSEPLGVIESQYQQAINNINKVKQVLIDGYADEENWSKLMKVNSINLEMAQSLKELNAAQRKLYAELAGQNAPFPSDLLNAESKKLLEKLK